jgi:hypothetical protein
VWQNLHSWSVWQQHLHAWSVSTQTSLVCLPKPTLLICTTTLNYAVAIHFIPIVRWPFFNMPANQAPNTLTSFTMVCGSWLSSSLYLWMECCVTYLDTCHLQQRKNRKLSLYNLWHSSDVSHIFTGRYVII